MRDPTLPGFIRRSIIDRRVQAPPIAYDAGGGNGAAPNLPNHAAITDGPATAEPAVESSDAVADVATAEPSVSDSGGGTEPSVQVSSE